MSVLSDRQLEGNMPLKLLKTFAERLQSWSKSIYKLGTFIDFELHTAFKIWLKWKRKYCELNKKKIEKWPKY